MNFFAAFIITYNRPKEVLGAINNLFLQTFPPEKILVVDNSSGFETENAIKLLKNPRIEHYRVGRNSGPAGAAKAGLTMLANEGFEWVYWGDDNNPPRTLDAFERIFKLRSKLNNSRIGVLGLMGNNFSLHTAKIHLIKPQDLQGIMPVNSLAGGSTMVVNTQVIRRSAILPDERLFFGFEELDFCLRIIQEGYEIFIDAEYYREQKMLATKQKKSRIEKISVNARTNSLWREYYSIRNLMAIVYGKHGSTSGLILILLRVLGKVLYSYSKGFPFGIRYTKLVFRAIQDFMRNNMGLIVQPEVS